MALLYILNERKKSWNEYLRLESISDEELFQSTRFPRHAVYELIHLLHDDDLMQSQLTSKFWQHCNSTVQAVFNGC